MPVSEYLLSFLEGTPERNVRLLAAQGVLPLAPNESLTLLAHLAEDPDADVALTAQRTMEFWPEEDLLSEVRSGDCGLKVLEHLADSSRSAVLLEAIILHPLTPGQIIERLALKVTGILLEAILVNRMRLLEWPTILANIKLNPAATPEVTRQVREIEVEFFGGKKKDYAVGAPAPAECETTAATSPGTETTLGDFALEGLPTDSEAQQVALAERISRLTVPQRVQQALLGTREARSILIRDTNKQVARSVLQSPKLSDSEIESFAAMRNVSDEVLREIGNNRSWTHKYTVVQNLVRNPKTPPSISQRMMSRLLNKDLVTLARDRGVPEVVRRGAERALNQRSSQKQRG